MSKHLKTRVMNRIKDGLATFVTLPVGTPHTRGVRYFYLSAPQYTTIRGAMDTVKEGQKYKKRIVVRPSRFRPGLHELYTFHFPTHWSAACVANRELIKEAQRLAHALEHAHTPEALEWRIRFFHHYFNVFKGHATPEPGLKPYSRFYQYTYVAIYRQLQAAAKAAAKANDKTDAYLQHLTDEVSFEPIYPFRPHAAYPSRPHAAYPSRLTSRRYTGEPFSPPPIADPISVPISVISNFPAHKLAYVQFLL